MVDKKDYTVYVKPKMFGWIGLYVHLWKTHWKEFSLLCVITEADNSIVFDQIGFLEISH